MNKILCCLCFWIFVIDSSVKSDIVKYNTTCAPPRGNYCVDIRNCPDIYQIVKKSPPPLSRNVVQVLRNHQCGFNGKHPLVCCRYRRNEILKLFNSQSAVPLPPDVTIHQKLYMLPTEDCGRMAINVRITGGIKAELNEFPWMALLYYKEGEFMIDFKCGGTVINRFYVLTAAHCVYNQDVYGIRLGEYNVITDQDCNRLNGYCAPAVQEFFPAEVIVHPEYSNIQHTNDIALIRLNKPANFAFENVQPICLPIGEPATLNLIDSDLTVSGWGISNDGFKPTTLLKTRVPIVPFETCRAIYRNTAAVTYKHICAGGEKGQDSCNGDSGGPLKHVVEYEDGISRYVQYGIVSYGPSACGLRGFPAIYTNVAYYMDWILDVIQP